MARRDRSLKRRPAKREPFRRFVIYCEGKNTEPAYFYALWRTVRSALVEVQTIHAGVPMTIAERASERAKRRKPRDSFEHHDQVWAAFDRDEHPDFDEAVRLCERNKVGVARSNPCFELWLILHEADFDKQHNRHQVQAHLRSLRPEYDPSAGKSCDCHALVVRVADAEARALVQLERRKKERAPFSAPSTTVGALTVAISNAAKEALGEP